MPLMIESHDDLPCESQIILSVTRQTAGRLTNIDLDQELSTDELTAARSLLEKSIDSKALQFLHPSIDTSFEPKFSESIATAHNSIAETGKPRAPGSGAQLSRYEEPSAPTINPNATPAEHREQWMRVIEQASVSQAYLSARQINLSLLEKFGKNAWLIGNSQLEEELRRLEKELADAKREVETIDEERRKEQEAIRGEMEGLEETWRTGVGRAIEAEIATEALRREVLEKSRALR